MLTNNIQPIPLLPYYGTFPYTAALPSFYWDVKSPEQRIYDICLVLDKLIAYDNEQTDAINENSNQTNTLAELFDKFMQTGFNDYYKEQVKQWVNDNLEFIYTETAKQVFFGLTDNGYFCAYIPNSWSEITFDTGAVYGTEQYGRLILRYNVFNGQGVIDNTRSNYAENPFNASLSEGGN